MNWNMFHSLLKKYREGRATEEEILLVEQWYRALGKDESEINTDEFQDVEKKVWNDIQTNLHKEAAQFSKVKLIKRSWVRVAIAAGISGIILFAALWFGTNKSNIESLAEKKPSASHLLHTTNNSDSIISVRLEDGSIVDLDPHSTLSYPEFFNDAERNVHLEGNAFFSVAKKPSVPFNVFSGNLVTQVLGTSFYIKTDKHSKNVEVSVRTGKVSVYESEKDQLSKRTGRKMNNSGVVVTPNQKVTYYPKLHHFITSLVEKPEVVDSAAATISSSFLFEDTKLSGVINQLEKTYNISFIVENESLKDCPFTGDISQQDLFSKLDLICLSIGIDYEVKGTNILLKGKGCN